MSEAEKKPTMLDQYTPVRNGRVEILTNNAIAIIRMNRPEKRNALDSEQIACLVEALSWFATAPDIRAAVLTGAGDAFCAGGDIEMFQGINSDTAWDYTRRGYDLLRPLEIGRKPIIAAVSGYCLAGGLEIALACDFIIADETAKFGMAEVNLGLIPGWGGTVRLGRALPSRLARQLVMTCERIDAEHARAVGLVNEVTQAGDAVRRSVELAALIASQPTLAVQGAKTVLNAIEADTDEMLALEGSISAGLFNTTAVTKRVQAWVERASAKASD